MAPRKPNNRTSDSKLDSNSVVEFLRKKGVPYSESRLIEELFKIKKKDDMPVAAKDLQKLRSIKELLRTLVQEKKIFAANFEDANTKEQVPHYSAKGWFVTP
jgi:hypothetical protein